MHRYALFHLRKSYVDPYLLHFLITFTMKYTVKLQSQYLLHCHAIPAVIASGWAHSLDYTSHTPTPSPRV